MTSQPSLQTIAIHVLSKISQSKGNQTMRSGQLIEHTREIFFFKISAENEVRRLVPDLFLFFQKALYEVKSSGRLLIQRYAQF